VRVSVAVLFVVSVLAAAVAGNRPAGPTPVPVATTTTTTAALEPSTTVAPALPTPAAPAPPPAAAESAPAQPGVLVSATGVALPVVGGSPGAWRVLTPCSNTVTLAKGTPAPAAPIVIDPGHGGDEPGAIGPNGLTEAVLNMAVAHHAQAALEQAGYRVLLTRSAEYRMTLDARARVALAAHARAFVSIHHNAEPDGPFPKPGTETYYQIANPESKRLAGLVYEEVARALAVYPVAWVADRDAGAKYRTGSTGDDYYGVLRRSHGVPAALAELAYLTDPAEAALLARADVQQVEGQAVARGIIRFLTTRDLGSGFTVPYPRTEPAGGGGGPENCTDPRL
jgi:N-acetylmuramoyl-L-alanine amidase